MKLSDDAFLQEQPRPQPRRRLTSAELGGLAGVGDRHARTTQDFFAREFGAPVVPNEVVETPNGRFSAGDTAEFIDPHGQRLACRIKEISPSGAIVDVGGDLALIPVQTLFPYTARAASKRSILRFALRGSGVGTISETRAPLPVNASGRDFAITLQGWNVNKPTEDEVLTYVAQRYPGARVLDADASYPGNKIGVVIHLPDGFTHAAQGMVPIHGPEHAPRDLPEGAGLSDEFVGDRPGGLQSTAELGRRQVLLEKTGAILTAIAAANPDFDFFETSVEVEADRVLSHFAVQQDTSPVFLRTSALGGIELTAVLSQGAAPAIGYVAADSAGTVTSGMFSPTGEVPITAVRNLVAQQDMFSPVTTTHEEDAMHPQADVEVEGAPPARGRGNPMEYYTKQQFEDEMARYRNEQQQQLLQEQRSKQLRQQQTPQTMPDWMDAPTPAPSVGLTEKYPPSAEAPPDWLDTTPLSQQVKGDAGAEHIGGPGLAVAERAAADQSTKDYWTGYFDTPETEGYGEELTDDVARKKDAKAIITTAWKEAGMRLTAAHLFRGMQIFTTPVARTAQADDLASSLLHSRETDPSAANAIDKLVADYLARNPDVLEQLGVYDQALRGAVQYWEAMQPKRLEKLRSKYAPEQAPVGTAGQPGLVQQLRDRIDPMQRMERELDTGAHGPMMTPEQQALEDSFGLGGGQPSPSAPAPSGPADIGEMNLEFEPDPDPVVTPLPPAAPATPAAPGAPKKPRTPKPREPFTPTPDMQIFDDRGQPVQNAGSGIVLGKFPSGTVRYKTDDGRVLMAFPPGVPTPAGAPPAAAPAAPAPAPAAPGGGGIGQRIKQRLMGASRHEAYRPLSDQYTADDPTPGTYDDRTPAENYPGRRQPATAELGFKLENLRRRGDYIIGDVSWDPDATADMSAGNVQHNIISFVKGRSTIKSPIDLGHIGRVRVMSIDTHAGIAEVAFRSSETRAVPPEQIVTEEGVKYRDF